MFNVDHQMYLGTAIDEETIFKQDLDMTWTIRSYTKQKHVMKINKIVSNNLVGYDFFIGTLKCFVCLDSLCLHKRHSFIILERGDKKRITL